MALRKRGDVIAKKATTIAIVNQKGGTAKTTTCENLGIGLAMEGKKVLLVDVDPQGSLTISMGWQQPDELPTTLSTLMQKAMNDQPIQLGEGIEGRYTEAVVEIPDVADAEMQRKTLPADSDVKNFSYTVVDGEIYYRENSIMTQMDLSDTAKERIKGMVELRQIVHELIQQQLDDFPDEEIKATQERLNTAYDAFSRKHGLLNDRKNARLFEDDSSYYLLCSLENLDENKQLKSKAAMFTKRTIRPERTITSVDTPSEALAVSIGEKGWVDLPYYDPCHNSPRRTSCTG